MLDTLNGQVLVLPINKCTFSAGYKNDAYFKQQGYHHYGVDLFNNDGDLTVYACGEGEVVECGWDGITGNDRCGNVVVIIYRGVYLPNDIYDDNGIILYRKGDIIDLTCRMFHFSKILCTKGQKVTKDTIIGYYGNTGWATVNGKPMGYHLHIEFDTDVKWPTLVPGLTVGGAILNRTDDVKKAGGVADSTLNPSLLWTLDYNQSIYGKYVGWYVSTDVNLQLYKNVVDRNNNITTFYGIDISKHNGVIDWNRVKRSGIDFAFIRVGWSWYDGGLDVDTLFKSNIENAIKAGVDVGVYVYAYDKTPEASAISADRVIEVVKDYKITYPIVYDMEEPKLSGYTTNSKSYNSDIAISFLNRIKEKGYYPMLYTYTSFSVSYLDMSKISPEYDIWIADYRTEEKLKSQFRYSYEIWQYTGSGNCDGVIGDCDRNYGYKYYPKIIADLGLNHLSDYVESDSEVDSSDEVSSLRAKIVTLNAKINELNNIIFEYKTTINSIKSIVDKA